VPFCSAGCDSPRRPLSDVIEGDQADRTTTAAHQLVHEAIWTVRQGASPRTTIREPNRAHRRGAIARVGGPPTPALPDHSSTTLIASVPLIAQPPASDPPPTPLSSPPTHSPPLANPPPPSLTYPLSPLPQLITNPFHLPRNLYLLNSLHPSLSPLLPPFYIIPIPSPSPPNLPPPCAAPPLLQPLHRFPPRGQ